MTVIDHYRRNQGSFYGTTKHDDIRRWASNGTEHESVASDAVPMHGPLRKDATTTTIQGSTKSILGQTARCKET